MTAILSVALGGAVGSVARYLMVGQLTRWLGVGFPWGTLAVNVVGGLLIGVLAESMALRWSASPETKAFLITGVLGGFTTFSAFSLDVVALAQRGAHASAVVYVAASVALSVAAVVGGMIIVRWISG